LAKAEALAFPNYKIETAAKGLDFPWSLAFLPDNSLRITSGYGFDYREDAQRLNNLLGKVIRINDNGSVPANNPFVSEDADSLSNYVFSYGHRNSQAILYDPI
jgi:glucose/arabinose dehydrogenase